MGFSKQVCNGHFKMQIVVFFIQVCDHPKDAREHHVRGHGVEELCNFCCIMMNPRRERKRKREKMKGKEMRKGKENQSKRGKR